jgi:hypothetical protein
MGDDDIPVASFVDLPLTTIRQPIGAAAPTLPALEVVADQLAARAVRGYLGSLGRAGTGGGCDSLRPHSLRRPGAAQLADPRRGHHRLR